jgi:hypothetical protein
MPDSAGRFKCPEAIETDQPDLVCRTLPCRATRRCRPEDIRQTSDIAVIMVTAVADVQIVISLMKQEP